MSTATSLNLTCKDCAIVFEWTAGEQAFYAERVLAPPKRCKACRRAKREQMHGPRSNDWRRDEVR